MQFTDIHYKNDDQYVVFNVDTTGLHPHRGHRIIEIGAVEVSRGMLGEEFHHGKFVLPFKR